MVIIFASAKESVDFDRLTFTVIITRVPYAASMFYLFVNEATFNHENRCVSVILNGTLFYLSLSSRIFASSVKSFTFFIFNKLFLKFIIFQLLVGSIIGILTLCANDFLQSSNLLFHFLNFGTDT